MIFVNNGIYGMTGGQMAPTTPLGKKSTTSPYGRTALNEGYPLHVCVFLNLRSKLRSLSSAWHWATTSRS